MGPGLLLNWFDLADESAADFNAWHSREHVIERLSIPGFVQGRRFVSLDAIPSPGHRYLVAYDTVDLSTLESPAYAARLDFPTPLTQKFVPSVRAMTRTAYEIVWSAGRGSGGFLRTIHLPSLGDLLGADGRELHENVSSVYGCDAVVKVGLGRPNGSITHFKDATREGRATDSRSREDYPWALVIEANSRAALDASAEAFEQGVRRHWPQRAHTFDGHGYQLVFTMYAEHPQN